MFSKNKEVSQELEKISMAIERHADETNKKINELNAAQTRTTIILEGAKGDNGLYSQVKELKGLVQNTNNLLTAQAQAWNENLDGLKKTVNESVEDKLAKTKTEIGQEILELKSEIAGISILTSKNTAERTKIEASYNTLKIAGGAIAAIISLILAMNAWQSDTQTQPSQPTSQSRQQSKK